MNKHLISLLEAAKIPKETYEAVLKEDAKDEDIKPLIDAYNETQLSFWADKHPDHTPEKKAAAKREAEILGKTSAARVIAESLGIDKKDVREKSFDEIKELISKHKISPDAAAVADEYKTKLAAAESRLKELEETEIPKIHNEYKTKESEKKLREGINGLFATLPVIDTYKSDFEDIVSKRISASGIVVKLNESGQREYFDKDGTKAKTKAGKDYTDADFVDVIKPNLKGYLKESNADEPPPPPRNLHIEKVDAGTEARQRKLAENKAKREATLA